MQIVVEIPEETVNKIKNNVMFAGTISSGILWDVTSAIINGVPLSKRHGRLIDADELLKQSYRIDDSATLSTRDVVNVEEIDDASTIIEADKQKELYQEKLKEIADKSQSQNHGEEDGMSRFDQDREDLIRLIISICDYARLGYNISTQNNCNNCKAKDCKYRPDYGGFVKWNCPLWKGEQDGKV